MTPRCCGKEMDRVPEALGYVCSECRKFVVYEPPETQLQVQEPVTANDFEPPYTEIPETSRLPDGDYEWVDG